MASVALSVNQEIFTELLEGPDSVTWVLVGDTPSAVVTNVVNTNKIGANFLVVGVSIPTLVLSYHRLSMMLERLVSS